MERNKRNLYVLIIKGGFKDRTPKIVTDRVKGNTN